MKILWISHVIPYPPKGGLLMRCFYLFTELCKNNTVDLLALNQESLLSAYFPSAEQGKKEAHEKLSSHANLAEFLEFDTGKSKLEKYLLALKCLFSKTPYSTVWFKSEQMSQALEKYIADNNYDLIHIDTIGLAQYLPVLANLNVPVVLDHHNIESHMMLRRAQKTSNPLKRFYFHLEGKKLEQYERDYLEKFNLHITCSDLDGERLKELNSKLNVETIPNPVDAGSACQRNIIPSEGTKLLFIGGLDWYPNTDAITHFLEEIWPQLKADNTRLDIIGKNPSPTISNLVNSTTNVKLHGFVDSLEQFYSESTLYICPIRDGGGTKLKVLDAMANSQLVIGYPEAFEGLAVKHEEHCLIANSPQHFAELIQQYSSKTEQIQTMAENARKVVEELYDIKVVGERLRELYRSIV